MNMILNLDIPILNREERLGILKLIYEYGQLILLVKIVGSCMKLSCIKVYTMKMFFEIPVN